MILKKINIYIVAALTVVAFLISIFFGYKLTYSKINSDHYKKQKILYCQLTKQSDSLLTKLLYQYEKQKTILINKTKEVLKYLENRDYNSPLDKIYNQINSGEKNSPYNIYITDKYLTIVNTTFEYDKGFNLSFAENLFMKHKKEKIFEASMPLVTISGNFMSFSDSYLPNDGGKRLLQIGYMYQNIDEMKKIKSILNSNNEINRYEIYAINDDNTSIKIVLNTRKQYLVDKNEDLITKNIADRLYKKIGSKNFLKEKMPDGTVKFYYKTKSPIFDSTTMVYSITMNTEEYQRTLQQLNIISIILLIIGLVIIYFVFIFKKQGTRLELNNKFIAHSVHEIKTPLSIISLNNELRKKKYGSDKYSMSITSAIRTLNNSYEDMTFLLTRDSVKYDVIDIELEDFIQQRVNYFSEIAQSQSRKIKYEYAKARTIIRISKVELTRLVDNNISNAIKYSTINSTIKIILQNRVLSIQSNGKTIKNHKQIFDKFSRSNNTSGGHGIGLSIVHDICIKYNITYKLISKNDQNTFIYNFNEMDL